MPRASSIAGMALTRLLAPRRCVMPHFGVEAELLVVLERVLAEDALTARPYPLRAAPAKIE